MRKILFPCQCSYGKLGPIGYLTLQWYSSNLVEILQNTSYLCSLDSICNMLSNRFSSHNAHSSLENFHHLKKKSSVAEYINFFEEMMSLMQMDYPGLNEPYFISNFIVGLKDRIKHYLIPHCPQTLSETYWKTKELEKGILFKKSLLTSSSAYTKPTFSFTQAYNTKTSIPSPATPSAKQPPINPPNTLPAKQIPIKPREPGKCWGCQEPWTPEHKFVCKFRRVVNAMDVHPKDWLTMKQAMEDDNHALLQTEVTDTPPEQPPQLLMLSSHAAHGTSAAATFSVLLTLRGKKGIALIDSGSTDSFVDYIFAGKPSCSIVATESRKVKVAGGGYLESFAALAPTTYFI
jgi:hypothetical protein